jgi:hypothetical protein
VDILITCSLENPPEYGKPPAQTLWITCGTCAYSPVVKKKDSAGDIENPVEYEAATGHPSVLCTIERIFCGCPVSYQEGRMAIPYLGWPILYGYP